MKIVRIEDLTDDFFYFKEFEDSATVKEVLLAVKERKDEALREFSLKFDRVHIDDFKVKKKEIERAYSLVNEELIGDIKRAASSIRIFSKKQYEQYKNFEFEIEPGVFTGQRIIQIESVGIYVPGGHFPLISSLLMGVIPAKVVGVKKIVVCSPPAYKGSVHPAILVAADISGVDEVNKIGGVQAIGAMAYGTQSIKRVDKIVGPGNFYVTAAKRMVYGHVGIDFVAGPSEILIIADGCANPVFIAADLIAQAEHDVNAKPLMVTDSYDLSIEVVSETKKQLRSLKSSSIAECSLKKNGIIVVVNNIDEAVAFANKRAPEHLELQIRDPKSVIHKLSNYGTLFIGEYAAEVLGDYSSGLNHILPTNFASRYTGGVSVRDFFKIQTTLRVTEEGLKNIGPTARSIALAEGLAGHANSIALRIK